MSSAPLKVLVIDDEPPIRKLLRMGLETQGYQILDASNAKTALELMPEKPDLVILDLGLPDMQELELLHQIRAAREDLPIVVLSSRGDEVAKVAALDQGADDYVTKPFGMDELLARVRVAVRRAPANPPSASRLAIGAFTIDIDAHTAAVNGEEVHLTPKEFELLVYFARNPGKVLTHRALLGAVWGAEHSEQTEYLRVFVGQLRKKIEPDPSEPTYLRTEPWVGYRFDPGADPEEK